MQYGAVTLAAIMLSGFALSHAMGNQGGWAWVRAFCEAATVGALADWFAVVALFRRPMGLPIPHTAIIARNKPRLAQSLARFVREHFLETEQLVARIRGLDPAARLARWLAQPQHAAQVSGVTRTWARQAMGLLDEDAVRQAIGGFVAQRARKWDAGSSARDVLALLTREGRHQALLDEALLRLGTWLTEPQIKDRASAVMVKFARKEWPRLVSTVSLLKPVEGLSDSLADRLARALIDELHEILTQPDHALRRDYEAWLLSYIDRLADDPDVNAQVQRIKQGLIDHPQAQAYVHGLWDDIRDSLSRNLERDDSALTRHLEQTIAGMAVRLGEDPALRAALNTHLEDAARDLADHLRDGVSAHIAQTVNEWDERDLVDELELSIGRDLQFIRYNGTLVGGLIGVTLHALVLAFSA